MLNLKPEFDDWSYDNQQDPGGQFLGFDPVVEEKQDFSYELEVLESIPEVKEPEPEGEVLDVENK